MTTEYAEFLIVPTGDGRDGIDFIHEPCGALVLTTMTVHLDTVVHITLSHRCPPATTTTASEDR